MPGVAQESELEHPTGFFPGLRLSSRRNKRRVAGAFCIAAACCLPTAVIAQTSNSAEALNRWLAQLQTTGAAVQVGAVELLADGSSRARNLVIEAPASPAQAARMKVTFGALTLGGGWR